MQSLFSMEYVEIIPNGQAESVVHKYIPGD